jgi:hypothetical protein
VYDEKSGRFFETSDREECESPDDEFCMLDNATGKMIRLTLEEKERIFLDALQVSDCLTARSFDLLETLTLLGT